jgi:undecaprenyl diphosphate synthase
MRNDPLPRHIAVILDGNGRWAAARGLPRTKGHEHGLGAVRTIVRACRERGVRYLTLYAFSAANWSRPKAEVDGLMRICREFAEGEHDELLARGVRVEVVGELDELPTPTRRATERLVADTVGGQDMTLGLALSYGGRRDVVNAMRAIAVRAAAGLVIPEEIDEGSLRSFLTTSAMPDPDLVIRTGGEQRLSDFLLFESAYAELYFTETLWPDFDEAALDAALAAYARRQRRYGRTAEQVATTT